MAFVVSSSLLSLRCAPHFTYPANHTAHIMHQRCFRHCTNTVTPAEITVNRHEILDGFHVNVHTYKIKQHKNDHKEGRRPADDKTLLYCYGESIR